MSEDNGMHPGFELPEGMMAISKDEARRRLGIKTEEDREKDALDDLSWVDEWRANNEPSRTCTQEELDEIDNHPFFMKEIPDDPLANPGLAALRELVTGSDQTPDEVANNLKQSGNEFLRDRFQDPRGANQAIRDAIHRYTDALKLAGVTPYTRCVVLGNRSQANLYLQNFRSAGQDAAQAERIIGRLIKEFDEQATTTTATADDAPNLPTPEPAQLIELKEVAAPDAAAEPAAAPEKQGPPPPTRQELVDLRTKLLVRLAKAAADAPGPSASSSSLARAIAGVERALQLLREAAPTDIAVAVAADAAAALPLPPGTKDVDAAVTTAAKATVAKAGPGNGVADVEAQLKKLRDRHAATSKAEAAAEAKDARTAAAGADRTTRAEMALLAWGVAWARDVSDEVADVCFGQWQQHQRPLPSVSESADDAVAAATTPMEAVAADAAAVNVPVVVRWPEPRTEDFVASVALAGPFNALAQQLLPPQGPPPPFDPRGDRGYVFGNVDFFVASTGKSGMGGAAAAKGTKTELSQEAIINSIAAEPLDSDASRVRVPLAVDVPLGQALASVGHVLRGQGTLVIYGVPRNSRLIKRDGTLWL